MAATSPQPRPKKNAPSTHRDRILAHLGVLGIPLSAEDLDQFLAEAEREPLGPLEFVDRLLGRQADARRERTIQRRIRDACFREVQALEAFDWEFNRQTIDRRQIEELATGDFIRRCDNLVLVGQSGVGKSFLMQALGRRACALGYRVRYITSARPAAGPVRPSGGQKLAPARAVLCTLRLVDHRRIRLRPAGATGFATGDQPAVQDHRRPHSAIDVSGDQRRFRALGRVPGRSAVGDGVPGPCSRRRHHLENPRQIVSRPSRSKARSNHAHQIPVGIGVQQADDRPAPTSRRSAKRRNATLAPLLWCITQRTCRLLLAAKLVPFLTATVTRVGTPAFSHAIAMGR